MSSKLPFSSQFAPRVKEIFTPASSASTTEEPAEQSQPKRAKNTDMMRDLMSKYNLHKYSESEKQELQELLKEIIDLDSRYICAGSLSREKRQLMPLLNEKKEAFKTRCAELNVVLSLDSYDDPQIFEDIRQNSLIIKERTQNSESQNRKSVIEQFRPGITGLQDLSEAELIQLHEQVAGEQLTISYVTNVLKSMMQSAHFDAHILETFQFSIIAKGQIKPSFVLSTHNNLSLGYSFHVLLSSLKLVQGDYLGSTEFVLTEEQLNQVKGFLKERAKWDDDFARIAADLLGNGSVEEAKKYFSIGRKPISEIIKSSLGIGSQVVKKLEREYQSDSVCFLFNAFTIRLDKHPEKDRVKKDLEDSYKFAKLKRRDGERHKTFLDNDPYASLIDLSQLQKICPYLNKVLMVQRLVKDFTGEQGSTLEALESLKSIYGINDELCAMKEYKKLHLIKISKQLIIDKKEQESIAHDIQQKIEACTSISAIESTSENLFVDLIQRRTGIYFKERKEALYEPSKENIDFLYDSSPLVTYEGNQRHKDVQKLFIKLTHVLSKPFYSSLRAEMKDIDFAIDFWKEDTLKRLNQYAYLAPKGCFSKEAVDNAIGQLEESIAWIVFYERSHVSVESVKRALNILAGLTGNDLTNGCGAGFIGRSQSIKLALTTNVGGDISELLEEQRRISLEREYQKETYRSSESSMQVGQKAKAQAFLSIGVQKTIPADQELNGLVNQIIGGTLLSYTPASIYRHVYSYVAAKLWEHIAAEDNEKVFEFLKDLGFSESEEELTQAYAVGKNIQNGWQYAYLQQALPERIVDYLIRNQYLFVKKITDSKIVTVQHEGRPGKDFDTTFRAVTNQSSSAENLSGSDDDSSESNFGVSNKLPAKPPTPPSTNKKDEQQSV